MDRRLQLAILVLVAVAMAVATQPNIIVWSDVLAQGITRSPVAYLPLIAKNALPSPTPTLTPTPPVSAPADLVVTALAADEPEYGAYYTDTPIHLTMTIENQGSGDAAGFAVHWLPEGLGAGPTVVVSNGVQLAAGHSVTLDWDYSYASPSPSGSAFQTVGIADPTNVISETNETNNSRTLPLTVYWFM